MLAGLLCPGHFLGRTRSEQWCREGWGSAAKKLQHLPANLSSYLGYDCIRSQFPIPVRLWWPISHPRGEQRCLMLGLSSGVLLKLRFDCHIINHETDSFVVWEIRCYVQKSPFLLSLQSWSYYVKINFARHQQDTERTKNRAWFLVLSVWCWCLAKLISA